MSARGVGSALIGLSNRLRNIEETEKAKREMMERKSANAAPRKGKQEEDFSAARCTCWPLASPLPTTENLALEDGS